MAARKRIFILLLLVLFVAYFAQVTTLPTYAIHCGPSCLEDHVQHACKKQKYTAYYYNTKESKCAETPNSCRSDGNYGSIKDCETSCSSCHILLKKYKPNDNCLTSLYYEVGSNTTEAEGPLIYWVFIIQAGKCIQHDVLSSHTRTAGDLIFSTKEECDKKCPPII